MIAMPLKLTDILKQIYHFIVERSLWDTVPLHLMSTGSLEEQESLIGSNHVELIMVMCDGS